MRQEMWKHGLAAVVAVGLLGGCGNGEEAGDAPGGIGAAEAAGTYVDALTDRITEKRLINADSEPGNWMTNGRGYDETHYSPLDLINADNVDRLGLAWAFDLDTRRGQEATPLIVNGVMYFTTAWSKLKALNAATGELIWEYDPEVPPARGAVTCCDVVNRGAVLWDDKVYFGTLDGRLIAVEAATGEPVWEVRTVPFDSSYVITGAPRVADGKVFIGQGGGDRGLRGYVSAYDAATGDRLWRFYLVPGNPADGPDGEPSDKPLAEIAQPTWDGAWWENGTGGTPWSSMAYDPELNMLYVGAGNAGPWDKSVRSPGDGDNLFVASIVALDADTGEYKWHFQNTPGDAWDFTAVQPMILADLEIGGEMRQVLMQAPKNGYFYVLDRRTGEFISAEGIVPINWSLGLDENGRPEINPAAKYYETGKSFIARPGIGGAHNWQPMSYSPDTGLVYIPAMESPTVHRGRVQAEGANVYGRDSNPAFLNEDDAALRQEVLNEQRGYLLAWDPVAQREVWRVTHPGPFNGGALSTGGNLVFQGEGNGEFAAFAADTGETLWRMDAHGGIIAAPATYTVDGEQYVTVLQGWGGGFAMGAGMEARMSGPKRNISRVLTFKLDGTEALPEPPPLPQADPPPLAASAETVAAGAGLYLANCARCHGGSAVAGGTVPDLRHSTYLDSETWYNIVLDGALLEQGMLAFGDTLSREQATAIRAYVVSRAHEEMAAAE